jgi:hypothetical protein
MFREGEREKKTAADIGTAKDKPLSDQNNKREKHIR